MQELHFDFSGFKNSKCLLWEGEFRFITDSFDKNNAIQNSLSDFRSQIQIREIQTEVNIFPENPFDKRISFIDYGLRFPLQELRMDSKIKYNFS